MLKLEILDAHRINLLKRLVLSDVLKGFYMAGGTALSLQKGYRESVDFDFFTEVPFNADSKLKDIQTRFPTVKVINVEEGTVDLLLEDVQVSFFYYPYKHCYDFQTDNDFSGLRLASPLDIAAMKMIAIGGRGAKKDFYDLYNIILDYRLDVKDILDLLLDKYSESRNYYYLGMSLQYFEDAETQKLPRCFVEQDWKTIKSFFLKFSKQFIQEWQNRK